MKEVKMIGKAKGHCQDAGVLHPAHSGMKRIGTLKPAAVALAVAGVFVSGSAWAADYHLPSQCTTVGGTLKDGVCYIGDGTQTETVINNLSGKNIIVDSGALSITGGLDSYDYGIGYGSSGSGSTTTISNKGSGTLSISGGSNYDAYGIYYGSYDSSSTTISNEGTGTLSITGGPDSYAYGIYYGSSNSGSTTTISNEGTGTLSITGGSDSFAYGIYYGSYNSSSTTISNEAAGTLSITGGSRSTTYGIYYGSSGSGSTTTISNKGTGTLSITGGSDSFAYGIKYGSSDSSSTTISNEGTGTLSITGGSDLTAYGIRYGTLNSGSTTISNTGGGTLKILQNETSRATGIGEFSVGTALINSAGSTLELSKNAIESITGGSIQNSGIVNAEAGALFDGDYSAPPDSSTPTPVVITLSKSDGQTSQTQTDTFVSSGGNTQTGTLTLDEGWKTYSKWNEGGTINFTDVVEGTDLANSIRDQFQAAFGTGTTINFLSGGTSSDGVFKLEHFNALVSESKLSTGDVITSEALHHDGLAFSMGNSGDVTMDTGFAGIVGSTGITVQDGKSLTLAGNATSMYARSTKTSATSVVTDAKTTLTNGHLKLGIAGLTATQGILADVEADAQSTIEVNNGLFDVASITGDGSLSVAKGATLNSANISTLDTTNAGTLNTLGGALTVRRAGELINKTSGTVNAGALTVEAGGVITNFSNATLNIDSMLMNGTIRNNGTINVGGAMVLADGTSTTLGGKITAQTLSMGSVARATSANGPLLDITGASYIENLDLTSGAITIKADGIMAAETLKDGIFNTAVVVEKNGTFAFSFRENTLKDALESYKGVKTDKAIVALSDDLHFGTNGSLTVGDAQTNANINLGSDALLILDTESLHGGAIIGSNASESLAVTDGAQLAVLDDKVWGNHYIIKDYDKASLTEAGKLDVFNQDGEALTVHQNDIGLYITVGSNNILDKDAHFGLANNINAILDGRQDTASEFIDINYLTNVMGHAHGADLSAQMASLASQTGLVSEALRQVTGVHDAINTHVLSDTDTNAHLWAQALMSKNEIGDLGLTDTASGYDADTNGFIFGFDSSVNEGWRMGVALSAQKTDVEAHHSFTTNDIESYGLSLYGQKRFTAGGRIGMGVTYLYGDNDFTHHNLYSAKADPKTQSVVAGVNASVPFALEGFTLTPYAGIEVAYVKTDDFTAKVKGQKAFAYETDDAIVGRVPVGVQVAKTLNRVAGGEVLFMGDASVTGQFGDTSINTTVRGVNVGALDRVTSDVTDDVFGRIQMQVGYRGDKAQFSLSYGAEKGNVRDLSHRVQLNAKYTF